MLYVDDGSFLFESMTDTKKLITFLSDHFTWFGLEMKISPVKNPSNTEFVLFLTPGFFNAQTLLLTDLANYTLAL